jgi:hypothetical protein
MNQVGEALAKLKTAPLTNLETALSLNPAAVKLLTFWLCPGHVFARR